MAKDMLSEYTPISGYVTSTFDRYGVMRHYKGSAAHIQRYRSAYIDSDGVRPTAYVHSKYTSSSYYLNQSLTWVYNDDHSRVIDTFKTYTKAARPAPRLSVNDPYFMRTTYGNNVRWPNDIYPDDELSNVLLSKIDNQSYDLGAFLAESFETSAYVASKAITLGKFAGCALTGNFPGALKAIGLNKRSLKKFKRLHGEKSFSDRLSAFWLEYNFGIKPIVSDIQMIADLDKDPIHVLRSIRCSVVARKDVTSTRLTTYQGSNLRYDTSATCTKAAIYSIANPDAVARKALGLNAPLASAWELVPFSWLIDYVVGVGEWLRLRNATEGLSFEGGYRSVKLITKGDGAQGSETARWNYNEFTRNTVSDIENTKGEAYIRQLMPYFPRPSIPVGSDITTSKVANVLALGYQLKGKKIP